jgi:HAMP domain-containing protein
MSRKLMMPSNPTPAMAAPDTDRSMTVARKLTSTPMACSVKTGQNSRAYRPLVITSSQLSAIYPSAPLQYTLSNAFPQHLGVYNRLSVQFARMRRETVLHRCQCYAIVQTVRFHRFLAVHGIVKGADGVEEKGTKRGIAFKVTLTGAIAVYVYTIAVFIFSYHWFLNGFEGPEEAAAWVDRQPDNFYSLAVVFSLPFVLVFTAALSPYIRRTVQQPIEKLRELADRILLGKPRGGLPAGLRNELGEVYSTLCEHQDSLDKLLEDMRRQINGVANGMLNRRADAKQYKGGWGEIAAEVNNLTAAIVKPLDEVAGVLQKIKDGYFDARVTGEYKGYFSVLKGSVNATADGITKYLSEKLESELAKGRAEAAREAILSGIEYASSIQMSLLPLPGELEAAFADHSVIWEPRDVVGGDIYWVKRFSAGTVLCVCDCTGHGTPGALLTMLVVSALENTVTEANCHEPAHTIWQLEQRLVDIFSAHARSEYTIRDGCDPAVLFFANDGTVALSAGHINVFTCDETGVQRIRGQNIFVGEGRIGRQEDIRTVRLPPDPSRKLYIASDGLFDQPGEDGGKPFGYARFQKIIADCRGASQSVLTDRVWEVAEAHRGAEPRVDDFVLVAITPRKEAPDGN